MDVASVFYNVAANSSQQTTMEIDFSRELTLQYESETVLITLLNRIQSQPTATHVFKFAVDRQPPRVSTATAVAASNVGATQALIVADGEYFVEGDMIEVPDTNNDGTHTNQLYVVSKSGDTLTVRAYDPATYGCTAVDEGAVVTRISTATPEGGDGVSPSGSLPNVYEQYVQQFEDYFRVTNIQEKNRQYTGPERSRLRNLKRHKHAIDQEWAAIYARKVQDSTSTNSPRRQMGGLLQQLTTNVLTYGASLDSDELGGFMTDIHAPRYSGGQKRMVLASADLMTQVQKLAMSGLRYSSKDTTWGPRIMETQWGDKVWEWIESPALTAHSPGEGLVIHPRFIKKRPFLNTTYKMNVQNPKSLAVEDGFVSVWGFEVRLEEAMGRIKMS